jgi:hypothetical protein
MMIFMGVFIGFAFINLKVRFYLNLIFYAFEKIIFV